jgi:hypothetical protein
MSAPRPSTSDSTGVAQVWSQASRAPAACAISATAATSVILSNGFDGVSAQTSRVFGRIAALSASRSVRSVNVTSRPQGVSTSFKSFAVPK